jgi:hypothetical protein
MNSTSGWDVVEDDPHHHRWVASEERLFMTSYTMSRGGWPSVERGIEVSIKVHLDLEDSTEKERPACRLLVYIGRFSVPDLLSFLCYSTVSTSDGSCMFLSSRRGTYSFFFPCKYASTALSEALGISLSEVMDHYFNGSDEETRVHRIKEALD